MSDVTARLVADVQITAHASPRWRGAKSEQERIARNQELSLRRGDAVKRLLTERLREALRGTNIKFEYDVGYVDESAIPDQTVVVGSQGRGQSESIVAARGDKSNNDPNFRRVDIRVRIAHELQEQVPRRVVNHYKHPTRSQFWYVSVAAGVTAAAVASVSYLIVKLRNNWGANNQTATGHAIIGGAGVGFTGIPKFNKVLAASASFGPEASFYTTYDVDFDVFDGIGIRYTSAKAGIYFGYERGYLTFYGLGSGAESIDVSGWSGGGEWGASMSTGNGVLWLESVPPNYEIRSYTTTEFDLHKSQWIVDHETSVYFMTDSADLLPDGTKELNAFVAKVVRDLRGS
jgi:outer membrane protein OmpA-like peptidoglycan-associated protein